MAHCKQCGASGLFLRVNESGLCSDCAKHDMDIRLSIVEKACHRNENDMPKIQSALGELTSSVGKVPGIDVDSINVALAAFRRAVEADTEFLSMMETASTSSLQEQNQIVEGLLSEATILTNALLDKLNAASSAASSVSTPADEIMKYKNLLDAGAITSEEYEAKKRQLLSL